MTCSFPLCSPTAIEPLLLELGETFPHTPFLIPATDLESAFAEIRVIVEKVPPRIASVLFDMILTHISDTVGKMASVSEVFSEYPQGNVSSQFDKSFLREEFKLGAKQTDWESALGSSRRVQQLLSGSRNPRSPVFRQEAPHPHLL